MFARTLSILLLLFVLLQIHLVSSSAARPTLKVLYCVSCGMQRYFQDLQAFVEAQYPEFRGGIEGGLYPPPPHAVWISTVAGYLWIAGIVVLVGGPSLFRAIGIREPSFVAWMHANKVGAFFALFMMNNLANSLLATGAFEVYLGDELVFSRLQTKRFPSVRDIANVLAAKGFSISD